MSTKTMRLADGIFLFGVYILDDSVIFFEI
jgi:hypothetical protein